MFYMINVFDKAVATASVPTLTRRYRRFSIFYYVVIIEWVRSIVLVHIGSIFDILVAPRVYDICFKSQSGAN